MTVEEIIDFYVGKGINVRLCETVFTPLEVILIDMSAKDDYTSQLVDGYENDVFLSLYGEHNIRKDDILNVMYPDPCLVMVNDETYIVPVPGDEMTRYMDYIHDCNSDRRKLVYEIMDFFKDYGTENVFTYKYLSDNLSHLNMACLNRLGQGILQCDEKYREDGEYINHRDSLKKSIISYFDHIFDKIAILNPDSFEVCRQLKASYNSETEIQEEVLNNRMIQSMLEEIKRLSDKMDKLTSKVEEAISTYQNRIAETDNKADISNVIELDSVLSENNMVESYSNNGNDTYSQLQEVKQDIGIDAETWKMAEQVDAAINLFQDYDVNLKNNNIGMIAQNISNNDISSYIETMNTLLVEQNLSAEMYRAVEDTMNELLNFGIEDINDLEKDVTRVSEPEVSVTSDRNEFYKELSENIEAPSRVVQSGMILNDWIDKLDLDARIKNAMYPVYGCVDYINSKKLGDIIISNKGELGIRCNGKETFYMNENGTKPAITGFIVGLRSLVSDNDIYSGQLAGIYETVRPIERELKNKAKSGISI